MENPSFLFYGVVAILTALFCYGLVLALKKPFYKLATAAAAQINTILDGELDEDEKDRRLIHNLKTLILYLFLSLLILTLITGVCLSIFFALMKFGLIKVIDTSSIYFYGSMIVGSLPLLFLRKSGSDYSYWAKLLHEIVLSNYALGRYLYRLEKKRNTAFKADLTASEFVVVNGLARAGTTALTTLLFKSQLFHSTTYASMPFLMAPRLWARFYKPKKLKLKERAHGDKVEFSEQSVEALEEYFFKVALNNDFILAESLICHQIDTSTYQDYLNFQEFYRVKADSLYLTKNNNSILRYPSLRNLNDKFYYFILFRSPFDHARSLLKQHQNFNHQQTNDPFILQYMNWLGHHEFGQGLKSFNFPNSLALDNDDPSKLNFWIITWINYYQYVLDLDEHPRTIFISYQDLLEQPKELVHAMGDILQKELNLEPAKFTPRNDETTKLDELNPVLEEKANEIYAQLNLRKLTLD